MARNEETGVPEFLIPFQVDQSWYERYWWQDSAPRKSGMIAFFRRILSRQRLTRRQDVRADRAFLRSPKCPVRTTGLIVSIGETRTADAHRSHEMHH